MRSRPRAASIPFVLLAACAAPDPAANTRPAAGDVVLVHASDPHLLDGKRGREQQTNRQLFTRMLDTLRLTARTTQSALVITGDLGLEGTDPFYVASVADAAGPPNPALARARLDSVAEYLAQQIQDGPFREVYFVPGNNDVFLENATPAAWSGLDAVVQAVQHRLSGTNRRFRDLTACYRSGTVSVDECIAQVDSPNYVLVGFPSISFKNFLNEDDFRLSMRGRAPTDTTAFRTAYNGSATARMHRYDTLHQALLDRFREVMRSARTRGRSIIVLTHIPDLDDPEAVRRQMRGSLQSSALRLPGTSPPDAWNVGPEVLQRWRNAVDSPQVLGVLAGHFHDSQREVYYRPYSWSRTGDAAYRWKLFVTPPLALKFQENLLYTARGFSVLTLRPGGIQRRLHWYDAYKDGFVADPLNEPSATVPARGTAQRFSPWQSSTHTAVFVVVLLTAWLMSALWPPPPPRLPGAPAGGAPGPGAPPLPEGTLAKLLRVLERWKGALRAVLAAAALGVVVLAIAELAWGLGWRVWRFAAFWFLSLLALVILVRVIILPMLREKRAAMQEEFD